MKNRLEFFSLAIFTLLLSACSGSDQAPPNTQTVVNVSNQTASNFSQVSIEEHLSGKVFEAKSFSCPARQTDCKLYYTGAVITGPVVAIFKDSRGHTVGIYDVDHAPGKYIAPEVTLWSTGAYLYEALVNEKSSFASMTEAERQAVLGVFVSDKRVADKASAATTGADSTNHISHYEALALSFLNQQINGPVTVSAYVQNLAKRLSQREVAPLAEFSSPTHLTTVSLSYIFHIVSNRLKSLIGNDFIRSALAQTQTSCGDKNSKVALAFFSGLSGSIPKEFPIAGLVAQSTINLASIACNDTGAKLNDILDKLNAVQNSLNNLSDDIGKLTDFVAGLQTDSILQDFEDVNSDLKELLRDFQVILSNNGVTSLKEYVQRVGGASQDALKNILREQPDGVLQNLLQKSTSTLDQNYVLQIQSLTEDKFDSLLAALDSQCKDPSTGDVILLRVKCNLVIVTSSSRLLAAQAIALRLASDTFDLLEAYPQQATRYGYDLSKTAAQHKSELRDKFNNQADSMISKFQQTVKNSDGNTGRYEALDGLPQAMLSNITAANCSGSPEAPYARVPSVSAWVRESGDAYLVTTCKNNTVPVLSRYYIKSSNTDAPGREVVINVLGVLIPSASADLAKVPPYSGMKNVKMIAMRYTDYWPAPRSFAFYGPIKGTTSNIVSDGISGPGDSFQLKEKSWSSSQIKAAGLALYANPPNYPALWINSDHWMRFTDDGGYSYAFIIRTSSNTATLWCVTVECSADNNDSGTGLNFKKGPQKFGLTIGQSASDMNSDRMISQEALGRFGREINGWTSDQKFIDAQ